MKVGEGKGEVWMREGAYVGVGTSRDGDVGNGDICFQPVFNNGLRVIVLGILQLLSVSTLGGREAIFLFGGL